MKTQSSLSVWVVFGALLCFAPSAFSQSTIKVGAFSTSNAVLNSVPAGFLTLAFGPGGDPFGNFGNGGNNGNNNGCKQSDSNWFGDNRGGKCQAVPEGGNSLVYLSFAALCCLGAMVYRLRRQGSARQVV